MIYADIIWTMAIERQQRFRDQTEARRRRLGGATRRRHEPNRGFDRG